MLDEALNRGDKRAARVNTINMEMMLNLVNHDEILTGKLPRLLDESDGDIVISMEDDQSELVIYNQMLLVRKYMCLNY